MDGKFERNHHLSGADHWFRVTFQAVRFGASQYSLSYVIDDMGPNGSGFVSRVMESGRVSVSNAPFFTDSSVFSAFSITDEKNGPGSTLRLDRFEAVVNTPRPMHRRLRKSPTSINRASPSAGTHRC